MAKLYEFLSEDYGLDYQETEDGSTVYYGEIGGFYTTITFTEIGNFFLNIGINFKGEDYGFDEMFKSIKSIHILSKRKIANYVSLTGVTVAGKEKVEEVINKCIDTIIGYCNEAGYTTGCFYTGEDDGTLSIERINLDYVILSDTGAEKLLNSHVERIREDYSKPETYFKGIVMTILALAVIQVLWYFIGSRARVSASIIIILIPLTSFCIYRKFAGKVTVKGYVSVYLLTFISTFAVSLYRWTKVVYDAIAADPERSYTLALKMLLPSINGSVIAMIDFYFEMILVIVGLGILSPFFYKKVNDIIDGTIDMRNP